MHKVVESIFICYMHQKTNMTKFFKVVYTMFILISLFLVVTNADGKPFSHSIQVFKLTSPHA